MHSGALWRASSSTAPGAAILNELLLHAALQSQRMPLWEGRLLVRRASPNTSFTDEGKAWCQRVTGWVLYGDVQMVETLAKELER